MTLVDRTTVARTIRVALSVALLAAVAAVGTVHGANADALIAGSGAAAVSLASDRGDASASTVTLLQEGETSIPVERRALAGGILVVSIILMFGLAWLWRRMNPA
ncbi:MAG TPA: hypothetical protein VNL94_04365 [Candidatus Binatia bacterium]|nr:hypothetical protein [Candidatus Binatia bacterium]